MSSANAFNVDQSSILPLCKKLNLYLTIPSFNSVPNGRNVAQSKLKACADDKSNVAKMMISLSDRIENIVGKGENAGYPHFFLLPPCLLEVSSEGSLKLGTV